MKKKSLTIKQQLNRYKMLQEILIALLKKVQKKHLREPNSDWREYCKGCGSDTSPYWPTKHESWCLVVEVAETLRLVQEAMEEK